MIKNNFFYFILALFFGVFTVYIFNPDVKIIITYPSLDNLENNVYKDDNGICYKYQKEIIDSNNC